MALLPEIRRTTGGALGFRRPVPPEICELASRRSELPGLDLVTLHLEVQGLVVHLEEPSRLTLVFFRWLEGTSRAGGQISAPMSELQFAHLFWVRWIIEKHAQLYAAMSRLREARGVRVPG